MASVTYRHVYKRFSPEITVINDLNIEIADGEFLVFVGPSGCGKSTSLRMLAGLEEITEGEILIGDRVVNNVAPKDRDIAMVFQSYALYPHMTVYDNMAFGLKLRRTPKQIIDERVRESAKSLDIAHLLDRRPRQLSGGQRQRVALGRAIVREPAVFLLDEPLSNLDAKLRVEARAFISRLHQRLGTTFIYVTHDQTEALTMGTRIAVLSAGYLQQIDSPSKLYSYPDNLFVAGFIGSPAMNFFNAKVVESEGKLIIDTTSFRIPAPPDREHLLRAYVGKDVILGVRPEDIHHPNYQPADIQSATIEAIVDVIELMGNEKIVYLSFDDSSQSSFLARMDPRSDVHLGGKTGAVINLGNVHLFDAATEVVIREDPAPSEDAKRAALAYKSGKPH
ncbi:MAG: ABC transporter ATP-binding protein [Anaerolineae bacterium]|jgi:multiple sugar transport system ATP-binding protein|nr:MAG: ABC transporter ATP-binding protein [Anaerolineae bacterium]